MEINEQLKQQNLLESIIVGLQTEIQVGSQQDSFVLGQEYLEDVQAQLEAQPKKQAEQLQKRKSLSNIDMLYKEVQQEQFKPIDNTNNNNLLKQKQNTQTSSSERKMRINRKTSDDLINLFEQLDKQQIQGLLEKISLINQKTPDLRFRLEIGKLLPNELGNFSLNDEKESNYLDIDDNNNLNHFNQTNNKHNNNNHQNKKFGQYKKRLEKECCCCGQLVRRHNCSHNLCNKPCVTLDKSQKKTKIQIE